MSFKGLGSFHLDFVLRGVLIAVSVIDVLPSGVSSVYAFYDPALRSLELGKVTALFEIEWARRARLRYHYLGLYIHGCTKMAYKAEYAPAELLCPATRTWVSLDERVRALLDANSAAVLTAVADPNAAATITHAELVAAATAAVDVTTLLVPTARGASALMLLASVPASRARERLKAAITAFFQRSDAVLASRVIFAVS